MIPRRIALAGFLSYRDEQVFDFDGAPICLLTGPNGSGKSAVFDAVTFALYGAHRGGKVGADELITKGRDALRVEFDFEVAGATYRIQRTARRKGAATRQASRAGPDGSWQAVPDTHLDAGFNAWVRELVGLTYEAFTSSVLLLQGRAEALISAKPADRLVVLKEIVGLDRFERLHDRAADRGRALAVRVEALRARLQTLPAVAADESERAAAALAEAEAARDAARIEVDRLVGLEHAARAADRLRAEADEVRAWLDAAARTLAESDTIERGRARLEELRATNPLLETALAQRRRIAEAEAAASRVEAEARALEAESAPARDAEVSLRARRDELHKAIPAAERDLETLGSRLAEAARMADRARRRQALAAQLDGLTDQLARLPADPGAAVAGAAARVDDLDAAGRALPALGRLANARDELGRLAEASPSAGAALATAEEAVDRAHIDADAAEARRVAAEAGHRDAEGAAGIARIARAEAVRSLQALDGLAEHATCDHCGQPLTPGHLDAERARREAAVDRASGRFQAARVEAAAARQALESAQADLAAARRRLDESRTVAGTLAIARDRLDRDLARASADGVAAFDELSSRFKALVLGPEGTETGWLATTFPTPADLDALRRDAADLPAARKGLDDARATLQRHAALSVKADEARRSLAEESVGLPADPEAPRIEHERLAAEAFAGKSRLAELRAEDRRAEAELDRLRQAEGARDRRRAEHAQALALAAARRDGAQEALDRTRLTLPEPGLADAITAEGLTSLHRERADLEAAGIEARAARLNDARSQAETQNGRLADLDRRLAEVAPEARRPPAEIGRILDAAKVRRDRLDAEMLDAGRLADRLRRHRAERAELETEALTAEGQAATAGRLAELLGPRNLQRHLVREAEEGILRFADDLLDRLSAGQLTLRLRKPDDAEAARVDRALDLEAYNRETKQAIAVPFLSGSQRFRVAVALALGIGRYAGRLHRPIESVIIDEGFGSLDREGLRVMIRELQNLRQHVRRIILVSHQDEFADAFADGYRLEVLDGTTVATRFSK